MRFQIKRLLAAMSVAALAIALSASVALAGSFSIVPSNGNATCVGPQFGSTPNSSPWNGHFNSGGVVLHDGACD